MKTSAIALCAGVKRALSCAAHRRGGPLRIAGPEFLLPTATEDTLGAEKWGAGPTGVVLVQEGPWTYGVLANHIWSFASDAPDQLALLRREEHALHDVADS